MRIPEKAARILLFLALVAWMALAGALFLETVAISLGAETLSESDSLGEGGLLRAILQGYRLLISTSALFLCYHCFNRREWARKGAVALLVLDLSVWLVLSAITFLMLDRSGLAGSRAFIQIFVILFEVGLLSLLLDDHIKQDFQHRKSGVQSPKNG